MTNNIEFFWLTQQDDEGFKWRFVGVNVDAQRRDKCVVHSQTRYDGGKNEGGVLQRNQVWL